MIFPQSPEIEVAVIGQLIYGIGGRLRVVERIGLEIELQTASYAFRERALVDHKHQAGVSELTNAAQAAAHPEDRIPQIIKTKRFDLKPMQAEEAVMQMELLDKPFFVFANATSGQVNVIYRRNDGNVGLIEPAR